MKIAYKVISSIFIFSLGFCLLLWCVKEFAGDCSYFFIATKILKFCAGVFGLIIIAFSFAYFLEV